MNIKHNNNNYTDLNNNNLINLSKTGQEAGADEMNAIAVYTQIIKENIDYAVLREGLGYHCAILDEIVDVLTEKLYF